MCREGTPPLNNMHLNQDGHLPVKFIPRLLWIKGWSSSVEESYKIQSLRIMPEGSYITITGLNVTFSDTHTFLKQFICCTNTHENTWYTNGLMQISLLKFFFQALNSFFSEEISVFGNPLNPGLLVCLSQRCKTLYHQPPGLLRRQERNLYLFRNKRPPQSLTGPGAASDGHWLPTSPAWAQTHTHCWVKYMQQLVRRMGRSGLGAPPS